MRKTNRFYRILCSINILGFFPRQGRVDKEWDDKLNSLMERERITNITPFTVTFSSGDEVWIANHPYFSGWSWRINVTSKLDERLVPRYKTLWKFEELVLNYIKEKGLENELYY